MFCLLTSFITGIARCGFGVNQALSSRYYLNASLLFSLIIIAYLEVINIDLLKRKHILILLFTLFLSTLSWSINFGKNAKNAKKHYEYLEFVKEQSGKKLFATYSFGWPHTDKTFALNLLKKADSLNVFDSQVLDKNIMLSSKYKAIQDANIEIQIESFYETDTSFQVIGKAKRPTYDSPSNVPVIQLVNDNRSFDKLYLDDNPKLINQIYVINLTAKCRKQIMPHIVCLYG